MNYQDYQQLDWQAIFNKPVCQLDADNCFVYQTTAELDCHAKDGSYLIPAGCVETTAPKAKAGHTAQWQPETQTWQYLPDHRGQTVYDTETGAAITINQVGELPKNVTTEPRPSEHHTWDSESQTWRINPELAAQLKAEQQSEMWARIKQKRHDNLRHGVYVKSVGKWLHSDDDSRAQYTFMRTMATLPENMLWKTMDNHFITMTRELLDELSMQLLLDEQADFANAERHRAAMLQADNPLDYDYSSGWTAIFQAA